MIGPEARGVWKEIELKLRPYLARRVASPSDVDDLLQDIFVRMHRSLSSLRDEERFGGWVYRIARSALVDRARERARQPDVGLSQDVDANAATFDSEELQSELGECVALFISRLPSPYRQAVTLTELQGLTQKEAAAMLGVSHSGLKSRVQRGRQKIRAMFEECCQLSVDARGHVIVCEPRALDQVPSDCRDVARAWGSRARIA